MSESVFDLYDFVTGNDCEMQCYEVDGKKEEIITFVDPVNAKEFLELLNEHFSGLFDDGGLEVRIVSDGSICMNLMKCINYSCHIEEVEKWYKIFKRHSRD